MAVPTLAGLESFAHRLTAVTQAGSGFTGLFSAVNTAIGGSITFDTGQAPSSRHPGSMKFVESASGAVNVQRSIASGHRTMWLQIKFRVTAATATADRFVSVIGPTNPPIFRIDTAGKVQAACGTSGPQTTSGTVTDSNWHRLDAWLDVSSTTFAIDWYVDGVHQTAVSVASQTAADITAISFGNNSTGTLTVWLDDAAWGFTQADFPVASMSALPLYPDGEGTDHLGTTNPIVLVKTGAETNAWEVLDEWNGGTPNTTDYITYTNTATGDAASNYAEITLTDPPTGTTVIDANGAIAGFAAGTNADAADTQVVDSSATLIDHVGNLIDYSGSTTVLGYFRQFLARPSGGWDQSKLAGTKVRWGFSNDTNPLPRLSAFILEYAIYSDAAPTPSTAAAVGAVPAASAHAAAVATPAVAAAVAACPAVTIVTGGTDATAAPSACAAVAAVPSATVSGTAKATPSAAAAVAGATTPTVLAATFASPATAAALGDVPAPTIDITGDGLATPSTAAGVGAVPAASVHATAVATLSVAAAVAAVPAPTESSSNTATPNAAAAVASVPAASVAAAAVATPSTAAAVAAATTPTVKGTAVASPSTVAAIGNALTPVVIAGGSPVAMPSTLAAVASAAVGAVHAGATASPGSAAGTADVGTPTFTSDASPMVALALLATIPAPTVITESANDATALPALLALVALVLTPKHIGQLRVLGAHAGVSGPAWGTSAASSGRQAEIDTGRVTGNGGGGSRWAGVLEPPTRVEG